MPLKRYPDFDGSIARINITFTNVEAKFHFIVVLNLESKRILFTIRVHGNFLVTLISQHTVNTP
jgi:hypothetical protein